jgi:RimJ/RimL family protein N-acetyltransferase
MMNITGNIVTLRAIEEEDLVLLHKWANAPELQDLLGELHFPSSLNFHKSWFQKLQGDQLNHRFAIDAPGVGLIGIASLMDMDWRNRHAFHGMMLGEENTRRKGYGTDTVMAVMRYAFDELNLERLNGGRIDYNKVSSLLYSGKLGWKEEGRRRNYYFRKGRYWDQIVTGILKEDYKQLIRDTNYWGDSDWKKEIEE